MNITVTNFKYFDKGYGKDLVLIPGWASDYRIFDSLRIKYNLILPVTFNPVDFITRLSDFLIQRNIKKISLFGWSMGGFLAVDFASRFNDLVEELILGSVRKKYPEDGLEIIKTKLKKNKKAYLYKFYNQCFYKREEMRILGQNLFKNYCDNFDLNYLLDTLDFLGRSTINIGLVEKISKVKVIHGEFDRIAPIEEARYIKRGLSNAEFITLKDTGHIPFSNKEFGKLL